jgi:GxxExxY protein
LDPRAEAIFEDFTDDPVTRAVIGAAIEVHKALGPGLLESAYHTCLVHLLRKQRHGCAVEVDLPVNFEGLKIDRGYRMDLVVENSVIVEVKSVEKVLPIHEAQLLTYLRLSGLKRGLILNFNVTLLKNGITRRVLTKV